MFKGLLLNTLIIIMPVFIYQLLRLERYRGAVWMPQWLLGIICGLASILCMMFPVVQGSSFFLDLRWVPFIIAVLYGGYRGGIVAGILLLGYRAYVDFSLAFYFVVIMNFLLFFLLLPISKRFIELSLPRKILSGTVLLVCSYVIVIPFIWYYFYSINNLSFFFQQGLRFFLFSGLCTIGAVMCSIILFERIYENERMQQEFSKAEKLNMVSELAAAIAHEVRNPLTVVRGFIQLTKENVTEQHKYFMETAILELDRAEGIITDYLNFAKPKSIHKERLHISQELLALLEFIQSYANLKGVHIESQIEGDLFITGDPLQFKQVILNLVNAVEATENQGSVLVKAYAQNRTVLIQIADTGEGMRPDQLQRLGSPYYSTKEKGTGLGLMVTFRLVEEFKGRLRFESQYGKGTTAMLKFPCESPAK
ncbi:ATP-binding protein [Ectobacillus funiculus]